MSDYNWIKNAGESYENLLGYLEGFDDEEFQKDCAHIKFDLAMKAKFYLEYKPTCRNCGNFRNTDSGFICIKAGTFPDNINPDCHVCQTWEFDDVPF